MDLHIWKKPWSRLLKGKAIEVVETPKLYLKLATRCMEQANKLYSTRGSPLVKFNLVQCKYLAIKLQQAIQSADCNIKNVNKEFLSLAHPKQMEQVLEIFRLLNAMAMEVEGFIQNCRNEAWIQFAIMLSDTSELVATIGLNLEFCTNIFSTNQPQGRSTLTCFDATRIREVEVQIVKEMVDLDRMKLVMDLKNVIQSNTSSNGEWQLATFLLDKLEIAMLPPNINLSGSHQKVLPLMIANLQQMPDCLGKGAFGSVYKATWFGVEVAKKTFYGPASADFFQEVSILDGLSHPNVISLLWSMTDGKRCHLVMELMDKDLFHLILQRMEVNRNQGSPFNILEALDLILQIGEGMLYLHEKRIVHRDLKSHNILIRCNKVDKGNVKYLQAKVSDFGLSKTKERSATYSDMSLNVGTTRWMAPEMMKVGNVDEERKVTLKYPFKIDIYSFGMVCYEILTGEVPFSSLNHIEVKKAVLNGDRPLLPRECPNRLRTLIEACWSTEANKRPSFGNICEELRDLKYANLQTYWKATIYQCPLKDIVTIDKLVAQLSSPITKIRQNAANDIHLLAGKSFDHRIYIREQEAMPLLVLLYYSSDVMSVRHASMALIALSLDDEGFFYDTFPRIHSLKELSLLRNSSLDSSFVNSISKETFLSSAVGPIIEVLKSGRTKARENAAKALVNIISDVGGKVREKIRNSSVVPSLITLLEEGSTEGNEYTAILLFKMCHSLQEIPSATQAMVVRPLLNLIAQHLDGTMVDDAFRILVTLTEGREGLIAFAAIRPSPTPLLVKFIASELHGNKKSAILILNRLCLHSTRCIEEARESNVIEPLTHFAKHPQGSPSLKRLAISLLKLLQK